MSPRKGAKRAASSSLAKRPQGLAILALRKAKSHLDAAEAIASKGDYPLGYSTLVLCAEEEAKYILYRLVALGVATFDPNRATDRILLRERDLLTHPIKQGVFQVANFLYTLFFAAAELAMRHAEGEKLTKDQVLTTLVTSMEQFTSETQPADVLEAKKQAGFYSGELTSDGSVAAPGTQAEYEKLRGILEPRLRLHFMTASDRPDANSFREARAQFIAWRTEHGVPRSGSDLAFLDPRRKRP